LPGASPEQALVRRLPAICPSSVRVDRGADVPRTVLLRADRVIE
jgi:hypothetical protein